MRKGVLILPLWGLVILINVYFIYSFPLRHFNEKTWNQAFGPLLLIHIVFGMIALLAGPFQFFASIRKKKPRIHRFTGRIYLLSILVGATCAILLAINHNLIIQKRVVFGTGLLGLSAAWLLTSAMALWAIKKRNFVQHREWMIRSYVVTCGFTVYRILYVLAKDIIQVENADYGKEISGILAWSCWAIPLLLTETFLQANKIRQSGGFTRKPSDTKLDKEQGSVVVAMGTGDHSPVK